MPILDISRDELGPQRGQATLVYLQAVMVAPDDPLMRRRIFEAFDAARIINALDEAPDDAFPTPEQTRVLMRFGNEAPRLAEVSEDSNRPYFHGVTTGLVLAAIIHRRDAGHPRANLGDVMDLVSKRLSGANDLTLSRGTINNVVWPKYRCVAHLWAAYVHAAIQGRDGTCPCRLDRLADFLAIAEWYRVEGEGFRPKQSDRPVLAAAETWRMPTGPTGT
jgi:hypothetical protein